MKRFAKRPSPGTVMGTVALFVALGGVAGALPGKDTVDNGDVKDLKYKSIGLKNGWGGASGSYEPGAAIDAQGIVHLRGGIAQGIADGNNFGRLPQAVRPDETVSFPIDVAGPAPAKRRGVGDRGGWGDEPSPATPPSTSSSAHSTESASRLGNWPHNQQPPRRGGKGINPFPS